MEDETLHCLRDDWMKFKEMKEKTMGCSQDHCSKKHLACCLDCPERDNCETICPLLRLHLQQPFSIEERECKYLEEAKKLVFKVLLNRDNIL